MTIETAFSSMMPSTVTLSSVSATDAYGKRTFASGSSIQCRIQRTAHLVNTEDGKQIPAEGKVYCYGVVTATVNDKLVMPDATVVPVLTVETRNDEVGSYVTVLSFGKA